MQTVHMANLGQPEKDVISGASLLELSRSPGASLKSDWEGWNWAGKIGLRLGWKDPENDQNWKTSSEPYLETSQNVIVPGQKTNL